MNQAAIFLCMSVFAGLVCNITAWLLVPKQWRWLMFAIQAVIFEQMVTTNTLSLAAQTLVKP